MSDFTLKQLVDGEHSLEHVTYYFRQGLIDSDTYDAYLHAWQTGAPRFGNRQCHCDSCRKEFPTYASDVSDPDE